MSLAKKASEIREKDLIEITEEHGLAIKYGSFDNEGYLFSDGSLLKLEGVNQEFSRIEEPNKELKIELVQDESGEYAISVDDYKMGSKLPNKDTISTERRKVNIYQDGTFLTQETDDDFNEIGMKYTKEMADDYLNEMGLSGEELNFALKHKNEEKNEFSLVNFLDEKISALNPFSNKKKNEKRNKNRLS